MGKPKPKIGMAAISKDPATGMIREGCDIGAKIETRNPELSTLSSQP